MDIQKRKFLPSLFRSFRTQRELWLLSLPIIVWVAIFSYYPMYGLLMAFYDFVPGRQIWESTFAGLKHFRFLFANPLFGTMLRNTLVMSGLSLTLGFVAPIIFALLLNEVTHSKSKRFIQTVSYIPHFISWVVAGSMVYTILSSEGLLNTIMIQLGLTERAIPFLNDGKYYWAVYIIANIWKGMGWSAIIYLSAIAGVDMEQYEAGAVDGLGRFGMVIHITLPAITPTILLLFILGIGNILNAGFDYHLIVGTATTQPYWEVIDTFAYRYGVQQGHYSLGTAVTLIKSVIGLVLVLATNAAARRFADISII